MPFKKIKHAKSVFNPFKFQMRTHPIENELSLINQLIEVDSCLILLLESGICISYSLSSQDISIISKEDSKVGFIHFDHSLNILVLLAKINNSIGCELLHFDQNVDSFPEKITFRKKLFLEPFADQIEFSPFPMNFFVKFQTHYKIFGIRENTLQIEITPKFWQFKHSTQLLLFCEEITFRNWNYYIPIKVFDRRGVFLNKFNVILNGNSGIEIFDLFEFHLILKQFKDELLIISLLTGDFSETKGFVTPKAIEYHKNSKKNTLILCIYGHGVAIWGMNGRKLKEINFPIVNEGLYCLERYSNILFVIKQKNEGNKRKCLKAINLENLSNQDLTIENTQGLGLISASQFGNVYIVNQNEIVVFSRDSF